VSRHDARSRLRLRDTWRLLKPYWVSRDGRAGLALLALVVALNLALVGVNVWLTNWNRVFYNALEAHDFPAFRQQLLAFCAIAAVFIVVSIFKQYYTMMLQMRWRTWLTTDFLTRWLEGQAYYRIEQAHATDNPDQRIADDLRTLASDSLTLSLGLLNSVVTLASFITILWSVSGALTFHLGATPITVPGYMVWFAVLYAVAGSWLTHKVGKPLIGLSFQQEQREADFRYALMRLRENAEGVALYHGEATERASLLTRFGSIRDNWGWLMRYSRRLVLVSAGYGQIAIVFPLIVAAPRYFARELTLGGLMQISSAFGQVQGALSWLVDSYASLVSWQAASNRVLDFQAAILATDNDSAHADGEHGIRVTQGQAGGGIAGNGRSDGNASRRASPEAPGRGAAANLPAMTADGLVLAVPDTRLARSNVTDDAESFETSAQARSGRVAVPGAQPIRELTSPFSLTIERGQRWLVTGPSGSGKSVFFRAMAGIWPYGRGTVDRPADARMLFLPQKSYLPAGTLADALCYPSRSDAYAETALREVLRACRLDGLIERLGDVANWSTTLSPGEQQRLAFARALLQAPDFLFLDEATSALDEDTEAAMYGLIRERLPGAALISIAHRSTVARWHDRYLRYDARRGGEASVRTGELPACPAG
jgi:putative ATP-binding cassette transporter